MTNRRAPFVACFALALLVLAISHAQAQKSAGAAQFPFESGEELTYHAEFSKALLRGVDVADFRFTANKTQITPTGAAESDRVNVLHFAGDVVSTGFFVKLFGVRFHEQVESIVDRAGFTVLKTVTIDEQTRRTRASEAVFDHVTRKVTWTERNPNNPSQPERVASAEFTEPVHDVLSGIYFLRTQRLEVGKSFEIQISDSGRVYRVPVNVVERKRMKTAIGSVYVLRVEPALFGEGGLLRGEGKLTIWFTDDGRHIPVRAQVKVDAGTFDIKLKRVTNQAMHH